MKHDCLEFGVGNAYCRIPESAMNDNFKNSLATATGVGAVTAIMVFGFSVIKIIKDSIPQEPPMYYLPQQPIYQQQPPVQQPVYYYLPQQPAPIIQQPIQQQPVFYYPTNYNLQ